MPDTSILVLHNLPLLAKDHPDAESEHSVVRIAESIAATLVDAGYRTSTLALGSDPTVLWHELQSRRPDAVFNLFEGNLDNPETESYVAGLLDWAGIPYTGCPFPTLALARAKHTAKYLLKGAGIATADFQIVHELPAPPCTLDFPVIVKPATQDASVGVDQASVCTDQAQLDERVRYVLATYGPPVLIEEYISGREFNVGVVELPKLEAMPIAEIVFPTEKPGAWAILTYEGKWQAGTAAYEQTPLRPAANLPAATVRKLHRLAVKVYRLLGCRDYARVDFRMTPTGKAYVLEVNPNPEIGDQAGFALSLWAARFTHQEFVVRLVEQALSRKHAPKPTFEPVRAESR